ncbi:unnamed protein product [Musa textilis]
MERRHTYVWAAPQNHTCQTSRWSSLHATIVYEASLSSPSSSPASPPTTENKDGSKEWPPFRSAGGHSRCRSAEARLFL